MDRRTLLKIFGASAVGTSLTAYLTSLASADAGKSADWGYIGENGADRWGDLDPAYQLCKVGTQQSPIDLKNAIGADLSGIKINYQPTPLQIINNGHTIQVNYQPGSSIILDNQTFNLLQFHFHHLSEHTINGQHSGMELHLVHSNPKQPGSLAVIGIMLKEGQKNAALEAIWQKLPTKPGPEKIYSDVIVNAIQFLPKNQKVYRYFGSLTTPPCSEGVNWIVMQQPLEMSKTQIQQFAAIVSNNARPVQGLKNRFLLRSSR